MSFLLGIYEVYHTGGTIGDPINQRYTLLVMKLTLALPSCSEQMLTLIFIGCNLSTPSSIIASKVMIQNTELIIRSKV